MAFTCDHCGARNSEVKTGGYTYLFLFLLNNIFSETSAKGKKITLHVESVKDINRFCFKSETCRMVIPELGFESGYGDNKGVYSTIEGILSNLLETMRGNYPFMGDSSDKKTKSKM